MASDTQIDELLTVLEHEVIKTHSEYDGSNRLTSRWEAVANAVHGAPCLLTEYTYVGVTTNVENSKESMSTWDSAWDI